MSIITPELAEKVAAAAFAVPFDCGDDEDDWKIITSDPDAREYWLRIAIAALSIAIPEVVEVLVQACHKKGHHGAAALLRSLSSSD